MSMKKNYSDKQIKLSLDEICATVISAIHHQLEKYWLLLTMIKICQY